MNKRRRKKFQPAVALLTLLGICACVVVFVMIKNPDADVDSPVTSGRNKSSLENKPFPSAELPVSASSLTSSKAVPSSRDIPASSSKVSASTSSGENGYVVGTDFKFTDGVGYDLLTVVNKTNMLSKNFKEPKLLLLPDSLTNRPEATYHADARMVQPLTDLILAARRNGFTDIKMYAVYRPYWVQQSLYNNRVAKEKKNHPEITQAEAEKRAATVVAYPGSSEHHLGLSVDLYTVSEMNKHGDLSRRFEDSACGKWLRENAHRFGFIMRYPKNKTAITKIEYEPWHFRYVGKTAAKEIYESGACLEEYVGMAAN